MKHLRLLSLITAVLIAISSCQKEVNFPPGQGPGPLNPGGSNGSGNNNNANRSIVGDYDFVGLTASTNVTLTASAGGDNIRTVTTSNYESQNNTGTVKITSSQFISNNVGYDVNTMANGKIYENGVLTDDFDFPFIMTMPSSSTTSSYVKISADSLSVTGSYGIAQGPSGTGGGGIPTGPVGLKLSWSGDTLITKVSNRFVENINQGGVPASVSTTVVAITKLKKK